MRHRSTLTDRVQARVTGGEEYCRTSERTPPTLQTPSSDQRCSGPVYRVGGVAGNSQGGAPNQPRSPGPDSSSGATCLSRHAPVGTAGRDLPHRLGKGVGIVEGPVRDKPPPSIRMSEADARRMDGEGRLRHCHNAKQARRPHDDEGDPGLLRRGEGRSRMRHISNHDSALPRL